MGLGWMRGWMVAWLILSFRVMLFPPLAPLSPFLTQHQNPLPPNRSIVAPEDLQAWFELEIHVNFTKKRGPCSRFIKVRVD